MPSLRLKLARSGCDGVDWSGLSNRKGHAPPYYSTNYVVCGGACGFLFQREMHALVPSVLLRLSGLDALRYRCRGQPLDRAPGEIEQWVGACEGDAIGTSRYSKERSRPDPGSEDAAWRCRPSHVSASRTTRTLRTSYRTLDVPAVLCEDLFPFWCGGRRLHGCMGTE